MTESNVELVRRGWEAASRGDLEAIGELLDPDVKWHGGDPDGPGGCRNREQALEFMREARKRRPLGEVVDIVDAGDKIVVIIRPAPAGDGDPELSANLTTVRDGRVVEMVHYPNPQDALVAAGV